jgi:CheY-like chemotaxis protein
VLVVEDHEDTRDMLRIALETEGYAVVSAANGVKLLPLIRNSTPDLILLDIMMPWVDGFELCKAIKANPDLAHIPVFFLSAKINPEDVESGFRVGAAEYISKPVNLEQLFAKIRRYLPAS